VQIRLSNLNHGPGTRAAMADQKRDTRKNFLIK
jgi:hypothetical protein